MLSTLDRNGTSTQVDGPEAGPSNSNASGSPPPPSASPTPAPEPEEEGDNKQRAEKIKEQGNVSFKAGKFQDAIELYTKAIGVFPAS